MHSDDSDFPALTPEQQLDQRRLVADAKLGVAEDLAWHGALFAACCVWLKFDSWFGAAFIAAVYYVCVTRYYRREHDSAWRGS